MKDFLANTSYEERNAFNDLYELEQSIVGAMHVAGVPLLAGTDFGNPYIYPGFSLLDELEEFEKAGLSPLAALQAAARRSGSQDPISSTPSLPTPMG